MAAAAALKGSGGLSNSSAGNAVKTLRREEAKDEKQRILMGRMMRVDLPESPSVEIEQSSVQYCHGSLTHKPTLPPVDIDLEVKLRKGTLKKAALFIPI